MRLTFLGAARMVTGSSYLLETGGQKILIDCGMFQGSKTIEAMNKRPFGFNPSEIDSVLLTHAHIDHSGLIPKLCKSGFRGPVYTTSVTHELCGIMLPDSGHIQEYDAEIANRKGRRSGQNAVSPLYTVQDAYEALRQFATVDYDTELRISPEITVIFRDAGHILGSAILEVWVTENGETAKLVFSGDLGQYNQPLVKDPSVIESADYIIVESTYGDRNHEKHKLEESLAQIINDSIGRGGNVIIPAFAVGRTQTILYYLHQLFKQNKIPYVPVIIDSPLAISATDIFLRNPQFYDDEAQDMIFNLHDNPLEIPQLKFARRADDSKAINKMKQPAIIISASGMADAGRVLHHLKHNLWRPESSILLVGFQAEGSLGRRLLNGAQRVKIFGEEITVKAQIHNLDAFSAHADKEQLVGWLSQFKVKPSQVFVVHGEPEMSDAFSQLVQERLGFSTYVPNYGDTANIKGKQVEIEATKVTVVDPAMQRLHDEMTQLEHDYQEFKNRFENLVSGDSKKLPEILNHLGKVHKFIRKTLNDV